MTKIKDYIRGDTRIITINCFQSDGVTPINLTGATVTFTLNSDSAPTTDGTAALQKIVTTHTSPLLGITSITITNTDTQNIAPGDYYYDVQVKDASGNITSLKKDIFTINPDITRAI